MEESDALADAISRLSLASKSIRDTDFSVDTILHREQPRKRVKPSQEEIVHNLEAKFLTPSSTLSESWLNQLQQRWDVPLDYNDLFELAPTQTRTITRFTREGLEGRVTGYREITVPASAANAKNSTSILRKPANRSEFVRGASGYFPFAPGGLDGVENLAKAEDEVLAQQEAENPKKPAGLDKVISIGKEGGLLEIPPGFSRGLDLSKQRKVDKSTEKEIEDTLEEDPEPLDNEGKEQPTTNGRIDVEVDGEPTETGDEDIDALLPVEFPALAPRGTLATSSSKLAGKEWAHMVDVNREITNFRELVPEMAREWPFELDTFQKEAVYHLENGDSVFVAAHTSAGKTVVAEYAISLAAQHKTKAIYTSPIKALSNQKFRDFKNEFDDVGILTGDVQINPEASCLIMTTEILRSMLYRGADIIRDVEFVIFDEVHYVNDTERGVVWEEVIIMLPEHVTLILLSATVPNTYEFASWVGRTKKKNIYVISTAKRPVPLEHYLWANKDMYKIVNPEKQFLEAGWKAANDAITGKDKVKATPASDNTRGGTNQRGAQRGGNQRGNQRGGPQNRGQSANRGRGNIARTGRGGGRTTAAQDRNIWVHLVQHLNKKEYLPACIFVFSKKRCEENADALANQDFCNSTEKSAIHMIIEKSLARLKQEDRNLPQIRKLRELLSRGIAVHHGGMLPILKEVVEILFVKTLVKVLFATETFAMGLNLPTRTVVFSGFRKYDSKAFRDLLPGEYTQMAGRAGRRGIDTVGNVIIVAPGADEAPPVQRLRQMILGDPTKLRSQFRLTYNMILNLLRVEALKIEEMIKRSFSENATQALLPEHEKDIKLSEGSLEKIKREPCDICDVDLKACHQTCMDYVEITKELHLATLASPVGRRTWAPRRLIVYKKDGVRTVGMLVREGTSRGADPVVTVLTISNSRKRGPSDALPYLTQFASHFAALESNPKYMPLKVEQIPLADVECVTETTLKIDTGAVLKKNSEALQLAKNEIVPKTKSWNYRDWDEVAWDKVKDVSFREILDKRKELAQKAQHFVSLQCPKFMEHYTMQHDEWLLTEKIAGLMQKMSDQNLQLLPDYEQRISVLKDLGFIDENERVELKGKVACEIHSADELVLTELVLENVLADYEPEEIVALLSSFIFQEKTDTEPQLTASLDRGAKKIIEIAEKVNNIQTLHQVIMASDDGSDFESKPRFGMVEVVYEWARGMSFNRITDLTDVMEGTIVRVITRLDETCREVKNAARIIGDPSLYQKMQTCQEMIKRDICATASLYM